MRGRELAKRMLIAGRRAGDGDLCGDGVREPRVAQPHVQAAIRRVADGIQARGATARAGAGHVAAAALHPGRFHLDVALARAAERAGIREAAGRRFCEAAALRYERELHPMSLKIKLNSIMVDDQDKALKSYTEVLGFRKGKDFDVGGGFRWITVTAVDGYPDVELVLEPNANPVGKTYQRGAVPAEHPDHRVRSR